MGTTFQDEVSPRYLREDRIDLTLDVANAPAAAFRSMVVNVSYARTVPQGVVLPLILEVIGPSSSSYRRREFRRTAPASFVWTPQEGGPHRVILREAAHNKWWGRLAIEVSGDRTDPENAP